MGASLEGSAKPAELTLSATNLGVKLNTASGMGATPLDWSSQAVTVDPDHIEVVGMADILSHTEWSDSGRFTECIVITPSDFSASRDPLGQFLELTESQSGLKISHSVIVAQIHHFVIPGTLPCSLVMVCVYAMISESPDFGGQIEVVGNHHSPFACGDVLDWMKTKNREIGQGANLPALVFPPKRMTGVGNKNQAMAVTDGAQSIIVTGLSRIIYGDDGLGSIGNFAL